MTGWGRSILPLPRWWETVKTLLGAKVNDPATIVTTGLVPVVHGILRHRMDCRDGPGNDGAHAPCCRSWDGENAPETEGTGPAAIVTAGLVPVVQGGRAMMGWRERFLAGRQETARGRA